MELLIFTNFGPRLPFGFLSHPNQDPPSLSKIADFTPHLKSGNDSFKTLLELQVKFPSFLDSLNAINLSTFPCRIGLEKFINA